MQTAGPHVFASKSLLHIASTTDLNGFQRHQKIDVSAKRTLKACAGMLLAMLALAACGSSADTSSDGSATTSPGPTSAATNRPAAIATTVGINSFAFSADTVTVAAGTTVTWTNEQDVEHTATADDDSFDSGNMAAGDTFEHAFNAIGTFTYLCSIHPYMTGTIVVE